MSNSNLINYTKISPHKTTPRNNKIKKITIHHMAGNASVETCGQVFQTRQASSNYGIGSDGRVGMYVEEKDRSWCSSSPDNDHQAITIEVANDGGAPNWHVSDKALNKLIELCVDICKRNGIAKLNYTNDKSGNLTRHNMFAATSCPGPYLQGKFPYIADEVNKRLSKPIETVKPSNNNILYRVQTGAFSKKENADALLKKVKNAGFEAYITQDKNMYKVQVGAYSIKENANAMAKKLEAKGFDVYITTIQGTQPTLKPIETIAREVLQGKWGTGEERKKKLTSAGYNYDAVQAKVNELLK